MRGCSAGSMQMTRPWWKDSDFASDSQYSKEQIGEGWLVLAKQDAFLQLHHRYQPLKRVVVLERRYQADDHELRKAVTQREIAL